LARVNYHFLTSDKFDPYVGIGVGYSLWSFTYSSNEGSVLGISSGGGIAFPGIAFEGSVGCRYYVAPAFAIWAEVGYGVDIVQLGVNVKFGGQK
jgi:outer membrane protein W